MYVTWKKDNPYFEKKKCKMIFIIFCAYLPPTLNTIYKLCRILEYSAATAPAKICIYHETAKG